MNIINRFQFILIFYRQLYPYFNNNHYSKKQQSLIKNLSNEHTSILNTKWWTFKVLKEIPKEGKNSPVQQFDFPPMF